MIPLYLNLRKTGVIVKKLAFYCYQTREFLRAFAKCSLNKKGKLNLPD